MLFRSKARHTLRKFSVQFERCSFGPFLEAAPGIPFRAGFRILRRSNGPARIVRKRASSSVALRRRRDGGALKVTSLRRRTSRIFHTGRVGKSLQRKLVSTFASPTILGTYRRYVPESRMSSLASKKFQVIAFDKIKVKNLFQKGNKRKKIPANIIR